MILDAVTVYGIENEPNNVTVNGQSFSKFQYDNKYQVYLVIVTKIRYYMYTKLFFKFIKVLVIQSLNVDMYKLRTIGIKWF
jgi:hypothetical protein